MRVKWSGSGVRGRSVGVYLLSYLGSASQPNKPRFGHNVDAGCRLCISALCTVRPPLSGAIRAVRVQAAVWGEQV